ncbi:restriction endonuclease subunit S [Desulfosporosinus fructosivorans]
MTDEIEKRIEKLKNGKVPEGYKREKGKIIPATWSCKKLGDVLQKVGKRVAVEKDVYYTQIGIRSHGKGLFYKEPVSGTELGNKTVFWLEKDCFVVNIVFAWEQAIGKTTENEVGMIGSHRFPMYRAIPNEVSIDYLLYFFNTKRGKDVLAAASPGGAGRNKTLGQKDFANSKVYLPPFFEQDKIAEILTHCDKVIKLKKQLIAEEYKQKKWLMQNLLNPNSGVRLEGFEDEWTVAIIKQLAKIKHGKNQSEIKSANGRFPILASGGEIGRTDVFLYNQPSVLIGRKGTIDKPVYIDTPFWTVDTLFYTQIFKCANPKFIYYIFCGINWWKYNESTGVPSLNAKTIESIEVSIPTTIEEQTAIANILSAADRKIDLWEQELEQWKHKKKALMQLLLNGIVRVNV